MNYLFQQPLTMSEAEFNRSCLKFEDYPRNLIYRPSSDTTLKSFADRLRDASPELLCEEDKALVPYCDLRSDLTCFDKGQILDDAKLQQRLGLQTGAALSMTGTFFSKPDPRCRFVFITANSDSRSTLKITRKMLNRLLTYHQVMPNFLDFLSVFGVQEKPRDIRFSSFRGQDLTSKFSRALAIWSLGRSGKHYQMCYNLKSVNLIQPGTWSIRQAAIHHQFDSKSGNSLWIFAQGHWDIKDRISVMLGSKKRPEDCDFSSVANCLRSSLAVHLLMCEWSMENWRQYLQHLEDNVEKETDSALYEPKKLFDLLQVQRSEEKANNVIMMLEANTEVLQSLEAFYKRLDKNEDFSTVEEVKFDLASFQARLHDMISDSKLQITRARLLVQITSNRKALVQQHLRTRATDRMEKLSVSMYNFTTMAQRDTTAMYVIAFITLIYLPATFVSTFFSTDVIKYQGQVEGSGVFSNTAMARWIQVTLPLTALTGLLMGTGIWIADRKRRKEMQKLKDEDITTSV
ncbi:hypothetical protein Egran_00165 [Elaphomyces granulatus]|uniref:CorA-like transporter domain-containing protein n=1 Tax=Elaphomyces granulatus TaxID=519963 RepID=A0A232M704_9EURO|nr:hypothetical protein Egran_00165 [Elaphomyces granulatus]